MYLASVYIDLSFSPNQIDSNGYQPHFHFISFLSFARLSFSKIDFKIDDEKMKRIVNRTKNQECYTVCPLKN